MHTCFLKIYKSLYCFLWGLMIIHLPFYTQGVPMFLAHCLPTCLCTVCGTHWRHRYAPMLICTPTHFCSNPGSNDRKNTIDLIASLVPPSHARTPQPAFKCCIHTSLAFDLGNYQKRWITKDDMSHVCIVIHSCSAWPYLACIGIGVLVRANQSLVCL